MEKDNKANVTNQGRPEEGAKGAPSDASASAKKALDSLSALQKGLKGQTADEKHSNPRAEKERKDPPALKRDEGKAPEKPVSNDMAGFIPDAEAPGKKSSLWDKFKENQALASAEGKKTAQKPEAPKSSRVVGLEGQTPPKQPGSQKPTGASRPAPGPTQGPRSTSTSTSAMTGQEGAKKPSNTNPQGVPGGQTDKPAPRQRYTGQPPKIGEAASAVRTPEGPARPPEGMKAPPQAKKPEGPQAKSTGGGKKPGASQGKQPGGPQAKSPQGGKPGGPQGRKPGQEVQKVKPGGEPKKFSMGGDVSASGLGLPSVNQSLKLEEAPPPRKSQLNIFAVFGILAGFIFWSMITEVDEIAVASGQIIPTGFVKSVQHLEGGIVDKVLVKDGDIVTEGQALIKLDGKAFQSDLEQATIRQNALRVQAERLRSFGLGKQPDFDQFSGTGMAKIITDQKSIYEMQTQNYQDQRSVIERQMEQKKASMALQLGRVKDYERQLEVAEQQRDVNKTLLAKKLRTRTTYLESEREVAEVQTDLNQAKNQVQETKEGIAELENRMTELRTRLRNDALNEMGAVTSEIAQLEEAIVRLKDKVGRLEIKSPSKGVVKGLKTTTVRGVIQPGEEIMQVVPMSLLEVEAKVEPQDIGNVMPGQSVMVKVTAFEYARHGGIEGKIKSISASTFKEPEGEPYYKAIISLSKPYVGDNQTTNLVSPGMVVQAEINTGGKTLLEYFIKPVVNAFDTAFSER